MLVMPQPARCGPQRIGQGAMQTDETSRVVDPPLDTLKPVAEGIWIVDSGPLRALGLPLPIRMTVVRLETGETWLHSATRWTGELQAEIESEGRIGHLVAPSAAHWSFLQEWQGRCPNAVTWAAPGLRDRSQVKKAGVRIDRDLADGAPPPWAGEIDQMVIRGGFGITEVAFLHRLSRTLILTDLIENVEREKVSPLLRPLVRLMGALAPDGQAPAHYRFVLNRNRAEVARAARQLLDWAPERVIFAHGRWFDTDGTARLRHALRWVLE
jgi:hypothetical protein